MVSNKLDKAIELHQKHMAKPATATMKSQQRLMDLLKEHKSEMVDDYEKEMPRKSKTLVG